MSIYSASKFALEGASESLWYEMRPFNVSVSLVRPGFIHSDGFRKVRFTDQGQRALIDVDDPYHAHYANMDELIEGLMTLTFYTPKDVAETILGRNRAEEPAAVGLRHPGCLAVRCPPAALAIGAVSSLAVRWPAAHLALGPAG